MASIKGVNRSAWVARSPDSQYMAAGTMASVVALSSSSSANLEIFKLDFQSDDWELPVVAKCPSSERFNRFAWGKNGSASNGFGLRLIAGALVDGSINLWNPLTMISPEANESAFVGRLVRHKGHFDAIATNLLASGAEDGEICIWDLANPAEPTHFRRLMVWDMRYTVTPVNEFSGHSKGVIAMSRCPHGSYLLTCAKDFQTVCWHTNSGEIVCELLAGTNWNYDVHWYPNKPGVISASSFDGKISIYNIEVILTENTLKKDPTRRDSLANLINMHESGDYGLESLLEMIALHLDAVYADYDTFSSCFSENCISSCPAKNDGCGHSQQCYSSKTPKIFREGWSRKSWKLRCRHWLRKHFSDSMLESEIQTGDLQLITYKAACGSYLYGEELNYVAKAFSHLEKENEEDLFLCEPYVTEKELKLMLRGTELSGAIEEEELGYDGGGKRNGCCLSNCSCVAYTI